MISSKVDPHLRGRATDETSEYNDVLIEELTQKILPYLSTLFMKMVHEYITEINAYR